MTVKPGSINMARILRHMAQRSNQSRKVTFYRAPLYTTDDYGVEGGAIASNEIQLPGLPALIRPALTADYQRQRSGQNIIGAGRIYTANLSTIKGMPNFNQDNNTDFNEIEGWDKFIDTSRNIYQVPTTGTTYWSGSNCAYASDGVMITVTASAATIEPSFTVSGTENILEADRITFKLKGSGGTAQYKKFELYDTDTTTDNRSEYQLQSNITLPTTSWLTVDVPFISGTTGTAATTTYKAGVRYDYDISNGDTFKYTDALKKFQFQFTNASGNLIYIKDIKLYKSLEWSVHSVKELNDDFNVFNVVRTAGRIDSRRRADAS